MIIKMKKFLKIASMILAGLFVICACSDSDKAVSVVTFSVDKKEVTFPAEGGKDRIMVSGQTSWSISTAATWLKISPANGIGSAVCEVVADSSLVNGLRSADIRIISGNDVRVVTINQTGFEKAITPKEKEIEVAASKEFDKRYFETEIVTNVEFKADIKFITPQTDWLSIEEDEVLLDESARPRTVKLRFDWTMNAESEERIAEIHFVPLKEEDVLAESEIITVRQKAAVKIEDNRSGDSIAIITISELLNCFNELWDTSERIDNWEGITLWEATDEDLPCEEAVGRVRSVAFSFFKTKESIPEQIKHLKYLESLTFMSNVNTMLLNIDLGPEICDLDYLKRLTIFSYGIVSLPAEFVKLGDTLEELDLTANNFNEFPSVISEENFPKLKLLHLVGTRRWNITDLTEKDKKENGIGLNFRSDVTADNALRRLFLWENLEELRLQNCYIEGELPDFEVGQDGVVAYSFDQDDVAARGDTLQWLVDNNMPKILPKMKMLAINLNFFTGKLPDWLLYHPYLQEWMPGLLVYNQQEGGKNSEGENVGFSNAPTNYEYYYTAFPLLRAVYELKEEIEE